VGITPWGTFEYLRMPFGLSNAGATFQRAMDYAFRGLIGKLIEIYQDDLTVFLRMVKLTLTTLGKFWTDVENLEFL
jgi:hypothetical protein